MSDSVFAAQTPPPRKMSRDSRRLQMIEATIETLALRGYARTTMADALATARTCAALCFPRHFGPDGLLNP